MSNVKCRYCNMEVSILGHECSEKQADKANWKKSKKKKNEGEEEKGGGII